MNYFKPHAFVCAISALCAAPLLHAGGFDQFVGLGDSTLDSGYFRYHTLGIKAFDDALLLAIADGAKGGFAGPGDMDSVILARRFGLNANPVGNGGTNYANGGCYTEAFANTNIPTIAQIKTYLSSVDGKANSRALYIVSTGNNDLLFVQQQTEAWRQANPNYLDGLASVLSTNVAALQQAGARTIIVPNNYNSAVFAGPGGSIASQNATLYTRSYGFTTSMWSKLSAAGVNFIPADLDSVFRYVVTHPLNFGFTAESVLAANRPSDTSALFTSFKKMSAAQQQQFLFIDGKHVTQAGQQIEADYFYTLLTAPSQVSLLHEASVQGALARTSALQQQLEYSSYPVDQKGPRAWLTAGASSLDLANFDYFPDSSSKPFSSMLGVDYSVGEGFIAGGALSVGGQNQSFSDGASTRLDTQALSLYMVERKGQLWGSGIATFGLFQADLERPVVLGTYTDLNRGSSKGRDMNLALRLGRDFNFDTLSTGPVLGFQYQRSRLKAFVEKGDSGVSALSYGGAVREAVLGQLGWKASASIGSWQLFGDIAWNHDWSTKDRSLSTSLTTVAASPYFTDAAPLASDWGKASLGVSCVLSERLSLRGTASTLFGTPRVKSFGGDLSLSYFF